MLYSIEIKYIFIQSLHAYDMCTMYRYIDLWRHRICYCLQPRYYCRLETIKRILMRNNSVWKIRKWYVKDLSPINILNAKILHWITACIWMLIGNSLTLIDGHNQFRDKQTRSSTKAMLKQIYPIIDLFIIHCSDTYLIYDNNHENCWHEQISSLY